MKAGSTSPDVVAIEARKAESAARDPKPEDDENDPPPWAEESVGRVLSLHRRRAALAEDRRPPQSVDCYDHLLTRQPKGSA
ncbi:hypothetical protein ACWFQ8_31675 [Streptomyces sp. NPDC055254]